VQAMKEKEQLSEADAYQWAAQCLRGIRISSEDAQILADRIVSALIGKDANDGE